MNRVFLTLFLCIISLCGFPQQHMKFMGIPIDGNARLFCESLIHKGFKWDNANVSNSYCLLGRFFDEDANIQVDYDSSNRTVYSVSVYIVKGSLLKAYSIQRNILQVIEDKYKFEKETINAELYQYNYYIFSGFNPIGVIQTFIISPQNTPNVTQTMLTITYLDSENYIKNENRKRNDI